MPDLHGRLTPQGNLDGTLHTIVYANNYNSLDNKPSINSVTLQGNKTASELGLAVPADITVTSVNGETGAVVLDGTDINYDSVTTVNEKLNDLQSQIENSGVLAVNGKTGVVTLTGSDINYSAGVTLNSKIDAVEAEIPIVNYPVTSVNGETGAVVLDGSDINYDSNTTIKDKIDAVEAEIPIVNYPVTSVNGETGAVVLDGSDIQYDTNNTINEKINAVSGAIPTSAESLPLTSSPTSPTTADAIGGIITPSDTDITFTLKSGAKFSVTSFVGKKAGIVNILNLKLTPTEATAVGTEIEVGTFANIYTYGSGTYYTGVVVDDQTKLVGSYLMTLSNQKLYVKFTESTTRAIALTIVTFVA